MEDAPETIRFFFDYISHNAYLAWTQLPELARRHGRRVEPVPVLFAALLGAYDQLGPAEVAPKARWMVKNLLRKTRRLGVPLEPPASHPFNPLLALRVSCVPREPEELSHLVGALFRAVWAEGCSVSEPDAVAASADAIGLDGAALVREAAAPEIKQQLRLNTDAALAAGVFGVPSMLVGNELFFGYDDFEHLERFLAGSDPLEGADLEAWWRVKPSAVRPSRLGKPRSLRRPE